MPPSPHEMTRLLQDWHGGDREALDQLMPLVVEELRRIADGHFALESPEHTLQPTALVNEVYLKLIDVDQIDWQCRAQFFGVAARIMRRVLVDHARGRRTVKRGGNAYRTTFDAERIALESREVDVMALDDALEAMKRINPDGARIVELRYFTGLTLEEVAEVLDTSPSTVKRKWRTARLWLHRELTQEAPAESVGSVNP